jgi:hypothetical protein
MPSRLAASSMIAWLEFELDSLAAIATALPPKTATPATTMAAARLNFAGMRENLAGGDEQVFRQYVRRIATPHENSLKPLGLR